jgi:tetratricopeptide (TPR) repeat protein
MSSSDDPPIPPRRALERVMTDLTRLLDEQQFASLEEVNAFLQRTLAEGGPPSHPPRTPLEEAQDLLDEAWEATGQRRVDLARQALQLSPDCADAYILLAEVTAPTPEEALALYGQAVAAGERAVGDGRFVEEAGHFWGIIATRPYMRARVGLARTLWALGRRHEAIMHYADMLRLNPNDNQGVRDLLLAALLAVGDTARARELLGQYDDASATWAYGQALVSFRMEGDSPAASRHGRAALRTNPHVPAYLLGRKRPPKERPPFYSAGSPEEAVLCAEEQIEAWQAAPGALDWLAAAAPPAGIAPRKTARPRATRRPGSTPP